jgi:hypothetical protein
MKSPGLPFRGRHDVERGDSDPVRVVGNMCVEVLAVSFVGAILGVFRGRGRPPSAPVAGDKGEDGFLSGTDLDACCLLEQRDGTTGDVRGVDAEAAVKKSNEHEYGHGDSEREAGQAMIERP